MELNQVIEFIKTASPEDRSAIKAELKAPVERQLISELCNDDIRALLEAFPRTDTIYHGYRYALTATALIQRIKELTSVIVANYSLKYTDRGCPMWHTSDSVSPKQYDLYRDIFHRFTALCLSSLKESGNPYDQININTRAPEQ